MPKCIGSYTVKKTIGQGSYGKVKEGFDVNTGRRLAIKVLSKKRIKLHRLQNLIRSEIEVIMSLNHKQVVELVEVLTSKDKIFIVSEMLTGGELYQKIHKEGKLKEDIARDYFKQLIDGLDYCHSKGVIHRDIKPENLLLDANGILKISDFGLAVTVTDQKTLISGTCGTPNYVAPEVLLDLKGYEGPPVDIWSAGVVLYVMLAGFFPFDDTNIENLFRKIVSAEICYPSWFSKEAVDIIHGILDVNAKTRFTINEIRKHPWWNNTKLNDSKKLRKRCESKELEEDVVSYLNKGTPRLINQLSSVVPHHIREDLDKDDSDDDSDIEEEISVSASRNSNLKINLDLLNLNDDDNDRKESISPLISNTKGILKIDMNNNEEGDNNNSNNNNDDNNSDKNVNKNSYSNIILVESTESLDMQHFPLPSQSPDLADDEISISSATEDTDSEEDHITKSFDNYNENDDNNNNAKSKFIRKPLAEGKLGFSTPNIKLSIKKPHKYLNSNISKDNSEETIRSSSFTPNAKGNSYLLGEKKRVKRLPNGAIEMNAFDLIHIVGSSAMSRMFVKDERKIDSVNQCIQLASGISIEEILEELENAIKTSICSYKIFPHLCKAKCRKNMKMKNDEILEVVFQIYECKLVPVIRILEVRNRKGDHKEYVKFFQKVLEYLRKRNIVTEKTASNTDVKNFFK